MATGGNLKDDGPNPPLYQSPQFQNEFPSLDGGPTQQQQQQQNVPAQMNSTGQQERGGGGAGQNQSNQHNKYNSNSMDVNLRPQTDWINQQQNSGNARGGGADQQQQNYTPDQDLHAVPQKVIALMPSFMLRGNQGPPNQGQQQQQQYHGGSNYQNQARQQRQSQQHYGGQNYNNNNNNDYQGRRPPPRMANRRSEPPNDERSQIYEDSVSQRPIIKEEDLDRIESLAKELGWAKNDEIDYNQKLQFSDDETLDDMPPVSNKSKRDDNRKMGMKHEQRSYKNDDQSGEFL